METPKISTPIQSAILSRIQTGSVAMRPKWQFALQSLLALVGGLWVLLLLTFLASFVFFVLYQTGLDSSLALGPRGIRVFFTSLPWVLVALGVVFIVVLEILMRRYTLAYRQPLLYSVLGILVVVLLGSATIGATDFHESLLSEARAQRLPLAGGLYRTFVTDPEGIHAGTIATVEEDGFTLQTLRGDTLRIRMTPETRPTARPIRVGARAVVLGDAVEGVVRAEAVRIVGAEKLKELRKKLKKNKEVK